ncbi:MULTISPECIES: lytic polysaccharide monooxygenase auxiliary activity family 9 protein [unclassified Streptomyces]|uniref:lytic polysaccharide monooxygenase auxiliary activity family 9 protein n=1 Tax=unclassified Streptomyces TaxID=2593676 RepID=UPI0006ADAB2E|nr:MULTISPECIES: lytic polysaccharide monooxygenase [unclassified Streptomyces]KOX38276.1 chitin-binding protein [Streptomyces sp. NRRL F-6491]KOX52429.1 chitin-binding protein [Streptomyces sp. NRRL F-6492]
MTSRRSAAVVTAGTVLALSGLSAAPAFAHGSMTDPVSRVSACYAEGPESPRSAACKAAVAASGAQAFYDWNAVNIANAAGQHRQLIPDGKLCSAGNDKYRGLDLARADWPASRLSPGAHTFHYKGTAPHKGSFELYVTKDGYDPSKPLKWSDLEAKPFLTVTDPGMQNGDYVFQGTVPEKSGRHLIYSIWQRSDSPEAFYTCSDVVFGQDGGSPAPSASAPTDEQIEDGAGQSSVEHGGHGDDDPATGAGDKGAGSTGTGGTGTGGTGTGGTGTAETAAPASSSSAPAAPSTPNAPAPAGTSGSGVELAETGGDSTTPYLAIGGAAVLAAGAAVLFGTARRRRA